MSLFSPALLNGLYGGDVKSLARAISLVENEVEGYAGFLEALPPSITPVIGITGPPGAGKSTLTDALIGLWAQSGKKVGVICVDPSSPFNMGALLGDRIRMSRWYNHPGVFIRSLATRGALGGLHPKIIEITDLMKAAGFDYVLVETVGVGQSEIEIAGLADITVVVLVPEAGDEIQTMKAGLMEIADIFVVNKADRPDADLFVHGLRKMLTPDFRRHHIDLPVIKTIANTGIGLPQLMEAILARTVEFSKNPEKKYRLLAEKAWQLIEQHRMKTISKLDLFDALSTAGPVNLYQFIKKWL